MATQAEQILAEAKANLERGRAAATGIGVFVAVIRREEGYQGEDGSPAPKPVVNILLRRRQEKGSLLGDDLSEKWELPGGGVELADFEVGDYISAVLNALRRELREETGLEFSWKSSTIQLLPAWIFNRDRGIIDLASVTVLPFSMFDMTQDYRTKQDRGEVKFFPIKDLGRIEIVSPRMRYLINAALDSA